MGLSKNQKERFELYGGDVVLLFDPEPHVYTLESNGVVVPSTTSITKVIDKPALLDWAVRVTQEYIRELWQPQRAYTTKVRDAIIDGAKNARFDISQEALDIGNMVHEWMEAYGNAYLANSDHMPVIPDNEQAAAACNAFLDWTRAHDVRFLQTELKVYSREHNYSGTTDLLLVFDGKLAILDYKTSKRIYPEYLLQVSAYVRAWEEEQQYLYEKGVLTEPPKKIEEIVVLRVPKDGADFEIATSVNIDEAFEIFLSCRQIYDWMNRRGKWSNDRVRTIERSGDRFFWEKVQNGFDDRGWGFPDATARKAHYFTESGNTSLCGKYDWDNETQRSLVDARHDHDKNCKACQTKLKKLTPAEAE